MKEVIIVRSLTDSDLGIFAAQRPNVISKQRALNINANIAKRLFKLGLNGKGIQFDCRIIYKDIIVDSRRHFGKSGKNWRLGGKKINGNEFGDIDSKDFALIRSVEHNDGSHPIDILFISRSKNPAKHAQIVKLIESTLKNSMIVFLEGSFGFNELAILFPIKTKQKAEELTTMQTKKVASYEFSFPPMPYEDRKIRKGTIQDKINSPHIFEQMIKASSDLSAPAQLSFFENIQLLSQQLRDILIGADRIISLKKDHASLWKKVQGIQIGFVDGGLANLSMLGSVPIAARVGGYTVIPGDKTDKREQLIMLKKLINEMYSDFDGGIYNGSFPDISALRDAARISLEAAGAVHLLQQSPQMKFLFLHGALINPVSRYSDVMTEGKVRFKFPDFSDVALDELLPSQGKNLKGRERNFINVYLQQLKALNNSSVNVCGVIEREAATTSVIRAVLRSLTDEMIAPFVPMPPQQWKTWFLDIVDPADDESGLGQRITDSLLFRCVLEPCEALTPVNIDRNEIRKAPNAWKDIIIDYPKLLVSYLHPTEWSSPFRLEIFEKNKPEFEEIASLIFHCALLLPHYAFPAGLDIVDKFAKIPNWMSKPVNTNTAVQALKRALYNGDDQIFDSLRRMLCGSSREWLLRPTVIPK
ncbi:MAG: DNA double-strand break repair nuclease NurA [Flavipsychrobacter sp.]